MQAQERHFHVCRECGQETECRCIVGNAWDVLEEAASAIADRLNAPNSPDGQDVIALAAALEQIRLGFPPSPGWRTPRHCNDCEATICRTRPKPQVAS